MGSLFVKPSNKHKMKNVTSQIIHIFPYVDALEQETQQTTSDR